MTKGGNETGIRMAINARSIMSNDISHVVDASPFDLPYLIWYPLWPREVTLAELARRRPEMRPQIAHACIAIDYQKTYDEVIGHVKLYRALWVEANNSHNKYYSKDLERRAAKAGLDFEEGTWQRHEGDLLTKRDKEPTTSWLRGEIRAWNLDMEWDGIYFRGFQANSNNVDLFVSSPEDLRKHALAEEGGWEMLYI